jgi:thiamine transporter ThiT
MPGAYDNLPVSKAELGPLDGMFRDTSIIVLVLFGFCCGGIALILSIICLVTNKDPQAKSNALIVLIISLIGSAVGCVAGFAQGLMQGLAK